MSVAEQQPTRSAGTIQIHNILGNTEVRVLCRKFTGPSKIGRPPTRSSAISRHTLIAWRRDLGFPAPIRKLKCGEVWNRTEVLAWLKEYRDS